MNMNVSVPELINMAIDINNGNTNQDFLVLLLQTIVENTGLSQCHVAFGGDDALRAKEVIDGKMDPGTGPLKETTCIPKKKNKLFPLPERHVIERLNPKAFTDITIKLSKKYIKLKNRVKQIEDAEAAKALASLNNRKSHEVEDYESCNDVDFDEYTKQTELYEASKFSNVVDYWKDLLAPKEFSTFEKTIGLVPKKRDMKEKLTVKTFKVFFDAYEKKFTAIHNLLSLQEDNINENKKNIFIQKDSTLNKLNIKDFEEYKVKMLANLSLIQEDIKQYTSEDPETLGTVTYIKDVNCLLCGTKSKMRINQPLVTNPVKIPLKPYPKTTKTPHIPVSKPVNIPSKTYPKITEDPCIPSLISNPPVNTLLKTYPKITKDPCIPSLKSKPPVNTLLKTYPKITKDPCIPSLISKPPVNTHLKTYPKITKDPCIPLLISKPTVNTLLKTYPKITKDLFIPSLVSKPANILLKPNPKVTNDPLVPSLLCKILNNPLKPCQKIPCYPLICNRQSIPFRKV